MSAHILIVACSGSKRPLSAGSAPAIDVYDGPMWRDLRKARAARPIAFETKLLGVFALSAHYGLISAYDYISHYDKTLAAMDSAALHELQLQVAAQGRTKLAPLLGDHPDVFVAGGASYADLAGYALPDDVEYRCACDHKTRGIGHQREALGEWVKRAMA